ncbi:hypothetical protein T265_03574 [Opisthorchis viverrini]|uniref:Uncharacterized protein n=1 Tax=Opisthorchis viverrini TaxID=6198 RepID=A0A075A2S4_OPIVI|nr:hypothetical protein T265_03574 [Opisthorchis viverrini]KER29880.1 hypothetical protein T265_03574 [Opisthorchis viverrini]
MSGFIKCQLSFAFESDGSPSMLSIRIINAVGLRHSHSRIATHLLSTMGLLGAEHKQQYGSMPTTMNRLWAFNMISLLYECPGPAPQITRRILITDRITRLPSGLLKNKRIVWKSHVTQHAFSRWGVNISQKKTENRVEQCKGDRWDHCDKCVERDDHSRGRDCTAEHILVRLNRKAEVAVEQ